MMYVNLCFLTGERGSNDIEGRKVGTANRGSPHEIFDFQRLASL